MAEVPEAQRWNRNLHYHPLLLELAPASRALDVGCGGGMLTRQLAPLVDQVIGLDPDAPSIGRAESATSATNVRYVVGDVLEADVGDGYGLVVSVAMLHLSLIHI